MPRRNRNPGSGKPPHNGPARNEEATGEGHWGAAKGAHPFRPLREAGDDYSDAIRALARDPRHMEAKAPLRELTLRTWAEVAMYGENEGARVQAAAQLAKRVGLPEDDGEGSREGVVINVVKRAD